MELGEGVTAQDEAFCYPEARQYCIRSSSR